MHRYQPDTIARIRTDYVHEQQARYRTAIADLEQRIANASTGERVKLNKKLTTLQAQDLSVEAIKSKTGLDLDGVVGTSEDDGKIYDKYFGFQNIFKEVQEQIKKISEEQTVVIMVDELDRCLPSYAIKVLERIHHVFNELENVVVIIAMEKKQMSNSLHQIYGDEMDVDRYLKKIISLSFKLDNGSANNFIKKYESFMNMFIIQDQERDELEKFLKEITFGIEIRAQEKIF